MHEISVFVTFFIFGVIGRSLVNLNVTMVTKIWEI